MKLWREPASPAAAAEPERHTSNTLAGYRKYGYTHEIHMITCVYLKLSMRQKCKTNSKQYIRILRTTGEKYCDGPTTTTKVKRKSTQLQSHQVTMASLLLTAASSKSQKWKANEEEEEEERSDNDDAEIGSTKRGKHYRNAICRFILLFFCECARVDNSQWVWKTKEVVFCLINHNKCAKHRCRQRRRCRGRLRATMAKISFFHRNIPK